MQRKTSVALILLTIAAIALGTLWQSRYTLYRFSGQILVRDDRPTGGADAIIILMGSAIDRTREGAKLYKEKKAPRIILYKPEDNELNTLGIVLNEVLQVKALLLRHGVPAEAIVVLQAVGNTSTWEEALAFRSHFASSIPPPKRIIVVTSWYHSRRAGWVFDKIFANSGITIEIAPANSLSGSPENWWRHEHTFLAVFGEYLKWAFYLYRFNFSDSK